MIANILSIAGSDPSGGAGIQADLKAFSALGTYGMAALTALTAQNTRGVSAVVSLEPGFVAEQIRAVLADVRTDAVKIGMIANAGVAAAVADALAASLPADVPVVLDPVMVAKGGARLLDPAAVEALRRGLLPRARVVTPNLPEAAALLDTSEAKGPGAMQVQARGLMALGAGAVLMKGGHLPGGESPDFLMWEGGELWLPSARIATKNTHGTGCSLSSAIAAGLGKGEPLDIAVRHAKEWLTGAIAQADTLSVGSGHGPVHHFYALWPVPGR